jgi:hypothetical protein
VIRPFLKLTDDELASRYDEAILAALAARAAGGNMEQQAILLGEIAFEKRAREKARQAIELKKGAEQ